jgi:hypothetical protein
MGKGRMSALDVAAEVKELRKKLLGLRVSNVYNLNPRTFQARRAARRRALRYQTAHADPSALAQLKFKAPSAGGSGGCADARVAVRRAQGPIRARTTRPRST